MIVVTNDYDRHLIMLAKGFYEPRELSIETVRLLFANMNRIDDREWIDSEGIMRHAISAFVTCFGGNVPIMQETLMDLFRFGSPPNIFVRTTHVTQDEISLALIQRLSSVQVFQEGSGARLIDFGLPNPVVLPLSEHGRQLSLIGETRSAAQAA
jgi:hypothetical protein